LDMDLSFPKNYLTFPIIIYAQEHGYIDNFLIYGFEKPEK
jgi:hypothetical protein